MSFGNDEIIHLIDGRLSSLNKKIIAESLNYMEFYPAFIPFLDEKNLLPKYFLFLSSTGNSTKTIALLE